MAKKVWLFFLVISVGYAVGLFGSFTSHPTAAIVAAADDSQDSSSYGDVEETDFC